MSMISHPQCDRRAFLHVGASGALGLTLPTLLAQQATAAETTAAKPTVAPKQVILVWLGGGLSQLDTIDMKPEAPTEIRGEFKPISTSLPGVPVCEHLPLLATRMKHWALVRTFSHREFNHLPGTHRTLTGALMPNQRNSDLDNILSRRDWPCYAAGLNYLRPRHDGIPNGVTLPHMLIEGPLTWPGQHAGFLGPVHDPMFVTQDPSKPSFKLDQFSLAPDLNLQRVEERKSLLGQITPSVSHTDTFRKQQHVAFELLHSATVAKAFRMEQEPQGVRDRYGMNQFGQSLLLAKRLVAAGVPIVQANMGIVQTWDTHVDNWGRLKNRLLPWLDRGLAALVDDLSAEGRLEDTLIVVTGEFGRTPKVSNLPGEKVPGRDHWAPVYSALFAGGGVVGGRVIGKSDRRAAYPLSDPFTPYDMGATIYEALGVAPDTEIRDTLNRPMQINYGTPMRVLYQNT